MTISREEAAAEEPRAFAPLHPGAYLLEELLGPLGLSQNELARRLGVSLRTVNDLARSRRSVTAEMALRLGRYFRMTPEFWLNMQEQYDLDKARETLAAEISRIEPMPV